MRVNSNEETYRKIREETEKTGITIAEACRKHGLDNPAPFRCWLSRQRRKEDRNGFVLLRPEDGRPSAVIKERNQKEAVIEFNGVRVTVGYSDPAELREILEAACNV